MMYQCDYYDNDFYKKYHLEKISMKILDMNETNEMKNGPKK